MFCPYCGTESTQGLNYCKRCGGNLAPLAQTPAQDARPVVAVQPGIAWAAGLTTTTVIVIGLGMIFPITSELAIRGVGGTALVWIALSVALAVFGCAAMLLRFWSLLLGVSGGRPTRAQLPPTKTADTSELGASRFDSLHAAPVPSITEQTTRTLEHAKKSRQ
jgi:hypothetical protein